ncbi:hypothetical protein ABZ345_40395 [Lentzea sp. NPDC005914]|uniref:hypothetical protein n=1 Tax=Lentzea sp. NPDC005914 TaxID=3154572 RepID=UPI0033FEBF1A
MSIEQQQSGSAEPATQVFAKIQIEGPTLPATAPATPATPAPAPAATKPTAAHDSKSLAKRIARRILGPTLMTKR